MIDFNKLSYWEKETFIKHTDVLIIGSGIVGLSTAIYLKERYSSQKVTIIERGYLPTGASTKNAGFSCIGSPSELLDDLKNSTEESVFKTVEKRWKGLLNLNDLLGTNNIGFESLGSHELFTSQDQTIYESCMGKLEYLNGKMAEITGKPRVFNEHSAICKTYGFNGFEHAISSAAEGQIDTGKMMKTLLKKAIDNGVDILNGIDVLEISKDAIHTNYGSLTFKKLAICTNGFSKRFFPNEDVQPARAQVIVTNEIPDLKLQGIFHYDAGYYYFRNIGNRVLFGGGRNLDFEGEKTEEIRNTEKIVHELKRILKENILPNTDFKVEHEWAGTMGVGSKKEPIIQRVDDQIYCGIRLGGMGIAIGSLVGKELAELIVKD